MTITIPDEVYEVLLVSSEESMRPLATEAVYRIKLGLNMGVVSPVSNDNPSGFIPIKGNFEGSASRHLEELKGYMEAKEESNKVSSDYSEFQEWYDKVNGDGYQSTQKDREELRVLEKRYGVKLNNFRKTLDKVIGGKIVVVYNFK